MNNIFHGVDILKKQIIKTILLFLSSQAAVFLLSFLYNKEITLLHYINISFYIGSLFILVSLLFFTIRSGFFDAVTKSFRQVFAGKNVKKSEIEEMTPPSEMISFNVLPFLLNGILVTVVMLLALYIYSF
ncbi:DUF3899 domain-containing protein [Robertmurraya kyonggiensis]|uniref:DUF3899 domain-containing protein n=1 Tax=Robertmurraya kyonggiensis TaxID=1037680 RepID=A0A4U1D777_9BACI|nr:DUF3899 domain-containing protein [Robertmurraya kyonggiensis]